MKKVNQSVFRVEIAHYIALASFGGERVTVTYHGKPRVALIPIADLEYFELLEREDHDREDRERSR